MKAKENLLENKVKEDLTSLEAEYKKKTIINPKKKNERLLKKCQEINLKGFLEKQKLTGPNFIDWYRQLRIMLSIEDKLNYLEQPIPPAPVAPTSQQVAPEILATHTAWVKGSKEIDGLMLMTIEPEIQRNLEPLHAHEMLKELKTLFAQQAERSFFRL
nr:zinc finger, CCHC-type [Tanacetum cinerariifolium]